MSDRPTSSVPDPAAQGGPAGETSALPQGDPAATAPLPPQHPAGETSALPQGDPAATTPLPPQHPAGGQSSPGQPPQGQAYQGQPYQGQPYQGQPSGGWPPAGVPVASGATAAGGPGGPRRWWDEATSTGGGRAALVTAAVLAALLLLTGFGLTTAFALRHVGGEDGRIGLSSDERGPGMGMGRNGNGRGLGRGNGRDGGLPPGAQGNPNGNGLGLGRGAALLGAGVLHGEFTTTVTGTPTVMVVQTGQVTAYTAGESLTVRSSDGFRATYTLDGTVTQGRGNGALATGAQVRVIAAKEGMKVTALMVG